MCTEAVVFCSAAPVGVNHFRSLLTRTNTIAPMIFIGKTAARPAQARDLYLFKCVYNIHANTVLFFNRHVLINPKSPIDTMAQMFGKLALDKFTHNKL